MTATGLGHDLVSYTGADGFTRAAVDITLHALQSGAVPVVLADASRLADVRDALGSDGAELHIVDREVAGRNPARVLPALQKLIADHPDRAVRCVSEPIRADDSEAVRDEVHLSELMLQLPAFGRWNCHLTCTYDTDLDPDVVTAIRASHDRRDDPGDAVDRARALPLPSRPVNCEELGVDRTTLSALRGFVQARAAKGGLHEERVDDLVYAVNEVVTNSICHGEGRARVSFWVDSGAVVCEVRDRGWVRDPLAGRMAPPSDRVSGRGLWLVNQLCDLVQLRSSPSGTTLRMLIDA
jgi:anti-sigma regulatory factor (Ser/Thr protein kinase)